MEVILLENIKKLGKIGSKVKVANGFARNFLLKNNKALIASKENLAIFEKRKEELNKKNNDLKNEAVKILKQIDKFELKITKNSMEGGALYGSLTIKEIIQNLEMHNFKNISANMIELKEQIKKIGDYNVIINLHADVQASIKVKVVSVEKIV
ncbi:MAG: 50S ribosomal protein L9 [Candidatus Fonsibacter lacus]|nr:50S ribosomal protein L9 [Candidatus Fonsibacter lacus]